MLKSVTIAVLIGAALSSTVMAESSKNAWSRYRYLAKFTNYMAACNRSGASPMSPDYMERLRAKTREYVTVNDIKPDAVASFDEFLKEDLKKAIDTGWLDGPGCFKIREGLLKNLDDPEFWK